MKVKVTSFLIPLIVLFSSLSFIDPLNAGSLSPSSSTLTAVAAAASPSNSTSVLLASGVKEEAGAISDQAVKDVENQESNSLDDSVKDEKDKDEAAAVKGTADLGDAGRNQTSVKSDDLPACPWFTCDNGRCLIDTWRCDQQDDCGDNSDEIGCENMICQPEMFRCASGMCITRSWLCDSFKDCPAGDDENNC